MKASLVSLEGNIGAGKSTLLREVQALLGLDPDLRAAVAVLPEPVDDWTRAHEELGGRSMLDMVYQDADAAAGGVASFQIYALMSRVRQALRAPRACRALLSERCLASDRQLFMLPQYEAGLVRPHEWLAYEACHGPACEVLAGAAAPRCVVYLRCSPEVCHRRVQARGRPQEVGGGALTPAYLETLHLRHERWVHQLREQGVPVVALDGDDGSPGAVRRHAETVVEVLRSALKRG